MHSAVRCGGHVHTGCPRVVPWSGPQRGLDGRARAVVIRVDGFGYRPSGLGRQVRPKRFARGRVWAVMLGTPHVIRSIGV